MENCRYIGSKGNLKQRYRIMGLAATQTRFLSLTSKKSNVEYQGQQINQQRTTLSNRSSAAYSQMLTLAVPTPPSTSDFVKINYQFEVAGVTYQTDKLNLNGSGDLESVQAKNVNTGAVSTINITASEKDATTGRYTTLNGATASVVETVDYDAYDDAYNQYTYKQYLYEQQLETINAETSVVQQQDKALELRLNQLDTEQSAIKTELEALSKVIDDNVESSFKTFG